METDRRDEDGMLPCPFCAKTPDGPFENLRDTEDMEDLIKVYTIFHKCDVLGTTVIAEADSERACILKWNTRSPTRDSAEGAREASARYEFPYNRTFAAIAAAVSLYPSKDAALGISVSVQKFQEAFNGHHDTRPLAPPKPAPDAMREALASQIEKEGVTVHGVWHPRETVTKMIVDALRSAPVPPADGAAIANIREAWLGFQMIREVVETLGPVGALPASEHLQGPTFTHEAEALVSGIKAIALSPSPAVTAESVAREPECILNDLMAAVHANRDNVSLAKTRLRAAFKEILQPLFATLPVRRDRETICEAIRAYCRTLGKTVVHTSSDGIDRIYYSGLSVQGIADAVIPVQPGAGERDICPYCDSEMEKDACSACGRERVPPEGYSRQAPHSSSETK